MAIARINYRGPDRPAAEWEAHYTPDRASPFLWVPGLERPAGQPG